MKKYGKYIIASIIGTLIILTVCFIPVGISKYIPMIEEQVSQEYGVKVHIEKLVLRLGPHIKVKTPIMHVMYPDGQKFAQFDAVKFYVSWESIFKKTPVISRVEAKNLMLRLDSDNEYLPELLKKLSCKPFSEIPNLKLKSYNFAFKNKANGDNYVLKGQQLQTNKLLKHKNYKLSAVGEFDINDRKYIGYDLYIVPKLALPAPEDMKNDIDIFKILEEMKKLDFNTDMIADLKFSKGSGDLIQTSGFINIENLSVSDVKNEQPKSYIYLTFLGDKVSLKSNIYASADKKIYAEGLVKNTSKPYFDIKVKTDDISLDDIYTKLKVLSEFSCFNGIQSINGVMNANFGIRGDLSRLKSNGYMKIKDGSLISTGLKVNDITTDIDFSDNVINIKNAKGYINKSPLILSGKIDSKLDLKLIMDKIALKDMFPESYGVKDGVMSLIADISGTPEKVEHKENLQIERLKIKQSGAEVNLESLKYDTNKSNNAYAEKLVFTNSYTNPLKIPSLRLQVEDNRIRLPETKIFMPNSMLVAKGEVTGYVGGDLNFDTSLKGFIHSRDIKGLNVFSARYPLTGSLSGNKSAQSVNAQVLVEQTNILTEPSVINLSAKADKGTIKLEDLSVNAFSGKFSDDYKSNMKGAKQLSVNGGIDVSKGIVLKNIRLLIPQQLSINLFDTVAQIKGDVFLNGEYKKPEIVGQFAVSNLFNQSMKLMLSNTTVDFNKNTASLNAPVFKIGDSAMGVTAIFDTDFSEALTIRNINVKAKYLNTNTFLMYKDLFLTNLIPVVVKDGKFYGERVAIELYGSPIYLSQLNSDIKLNGNILNMKNISAEAYNGKISGAADFDIKEEKYSSRIMGRGVSSAPIFDIVSVREDNISGTMDFDTALSGMLSSRNMINGDIKFEIHNGRMSSLGKLEHLLYAQNVIADNMLRTSLSIVTKAITLKDTGLFKSLRSEISMKNGIANIKYLQSQGPLMSLYIRGTYNPENDYAKLTVLGRLSDEVLTGLGGFGDFSINKLMIMLTGEDNRLNVKGEDIDKIPPLNVRNTKEFRALINGKIDKPSSVSMFNWISYSEKSYRQRDIPTSGAKVPSFVDELP